MNLEFERECPAKSEKIMQIITDYENIFKLMPPQFHGVILEQNSDMVLVEETMEISTLKTKIKQRSIHRKTTPNLFEIEIISGPVKNSSVRISVQDIEKGTKIMVKADLKLGLKYRILSSFIKKRYCVVLETLIGKIASLAILTDGKDWRDSITNNGEILTLSDRYFSLKFLGWWQGDLKQVFVDETYKKIPFQNRTVIDVGANIADSSIYFAINGATKVIALEPFSRNFSIGKENIKNNNMNDKIIFLLAGCSDRNSLIFVNSDNIGTSNNLKAVSDGIEIETKTLESILNEYHVDSAVLKMDCEGCEYESILTTSPSIIQKFEAIIIEYHNGYQNLEKKLQECGFNVIVDKNPRMEYANRGYILADRRRM